MNKIYSSSLQEIYFDDKTKILKNKWLNTDIELEDIKKEIIIWMDKFKEKNPKYLLTDNLIGHIVQVEAQDWITGYIVPIVLGTGISKYAIIMSDEVISELSVEQMVDEVKERVSDIFQQRNFNSGEKALKWLLA